MSRASCRAVVGDLEVAVDGRHEVDGARGRKVVESVQGKDVVGSVQVSEVVARRT